MLDNDSSFSFVSFQSFGDNFWRVIASPWVLLSVFQSFLQNVSLAMEVEHFKHVQIFSAYFVPSFDVFHILWKSFDKVDIFWICDLSLYKFDHSFRRNQFSCFLNSFNFLSLHASWFGFVTKEVSTRNEFETILLHNFLALSSFSWTWGSRNENTPRKILFLNFAWLLNRWIATHRY